jgi:hypothetical protein
LGSTAVAQAVPPYLKKFQDLYAGPTAPAGFAEVVETTRCSVCHIPEMNKRQRNSYGNAVKKAGLTKSMPKAAETDPKVAKAIDDAFEKAGRQKSSEGPTYVELFKAGKLHSK